MLFSRNSAYGIRVFHKHTTIEFLKVHKNGINANIGSIGFNM